MRSRQRDVSPLGRRPGRLPAGGRRHPYLLLLSAGGTAAILSMLASPADAQRVQFPTSDPTGQPVYSTPPPGAPYPTTPHSAAPPLPPPAYSPPAVGPPPLFDPYGGGGTLAAPPPAVPYTPPPPASAYPQQPAPLFPDGLPFQWQPAPHDIVTSGEGYWEKTVRFFQELSAEYTYLYGRGSRRSDLEINRLELSSTFAIPVLYNIDSPLLVTPGFAFNWLEGPETSVPPLPGEPDLPPRLYDAYLDFAWYPRWYEWLGGELGFRTGVWSDFRHVNTDSLRFLARGLASVALTPQMDVLFGVVYLDRVRVKLLPAGGFYFRPSPEWDMYLVFPNPKVRRYMTSIGNSKWYWYVAGEYGGGSWTARRQNNDDRFDYNDIRVIGGIEWETQTFIRGHLEMGYVFERELVFVSGDPPRHRLNDTFMLRAGVQF